MGGWANTDKSVAIDTNVYTGVVIADGGSTQALQINFFNKNDSFYDAQAFNINQNAITKYVRRKSDQQWIADATFTADEDTGWKNLIPVEFSVSGQAICRQKNGWVRIDLDFNDAPTMAKRAYTKLFTLPSGVAKPDHKVSAVASVTNSDDKVVIIAATTKEINAYNYSTTTEAIGSTI